jgi:hypothetical protein
MQWQSFSTGSCRDTRCAELKSLQIQHLELPSHCCMSRCGCCPVSQPHPPSSPHARVGFNTKGSPHVTHHIDHSDPGTHIDDLNCLRSQLQRFTCGFSCSCLRTTQQCKREGYSTTSCAQDMRLSAFMSTSNQVTFFLRTRWNLERMQKDLVASMRRR